jgi:hypothetical protein
MNELLLVICCHLLHRSLPIINVVRRLSTKLSLRLLFLLNVVQ